MVNHDISYLYSCFPCCWIWWAQVERNEIVSLYVTLWMSDMAEHTVHEWITYPGHGLFITFLWQPLDQKFSKIMLIHVIVCHAFISILFQNSWNLDWWPMRVKKVTCMMRKLTNATLGEGRVTSSVCFPPPYSLFKAWKIAINKKEVIVNLNFPLWI